MIDIRGIIIPASWDTKGNITGMAIATHKEEEYIIEDDEKNANLMSFLRQEVKITGVIKTSGGKKIIKIIKITNMAEGLPLLPS